MISNNRYILNYADHKAADANSAAARFGNSALGEVAANGDASILGIFRFSEEAVTRIEAIQLDDTSFVVAFRGAKQVDEMDTTKFVRQEVSCVFGQVDGNDLVFDPHPLHLEALKTQFWARSVSRISSHMFAYAYHSGEDQNTKLVTVEVDPTTHAMTPISTQVLQNGFSPFVRMVSQPYTLDSPHTLTFYGPNGKVVANVCSVDSGGKLSRCEDMELAPTAVQSFDATTMASGRLLVVFSAGGIPYYQVVGLAKQ